MEAVGFSDKLIKLSTLHDVISRDNAVGIPTRYGLDVTGFECRWGERFSAPVRTGPGIHPASYVRGPGSFSGVKQPGRGLDNPPPSSA